MYAWVIVAIVLSILALVIALAALCAALSAHQRISQLARPGKAVRQSNAAPTAFMKQKSGRHAPWVIYNPTKIDDLDEFKSLVVQRAIATGYLEPRFVETTKESPGTLQAIAAAEADADLVIAVGGDGTQRAVAAGLAHSNIPIGIIPFGTGNMLARNLDISVSSVREALEVALTGANYHLDLGWIGLHDVDGQPFRPAEGAQVLQGLEAASQSRAIASMREHMPPVEQDEHAFLVMSGVGFDADIMASTNPNLKRSIGWYAYVVSGIRKHRQPRLRANVRLGEDKDGVTVRARTLLLANCGQLPGNLALLPDAAPGDGWIDVAVLDTRGGVLGWVELAWRVIAQGFGVRHGMPSLSSTLETRKARVIEIDLEKYRHAQADGDVVAMTRSVSGRLDRRALVYRIP